VLVLIALALLSRATIGFMAMAQLGPWPMAPCLLTAEQVYFGPLVITRANAPISGELERQAKHFHNW